MLNNMEIPSRNAVLIESPREEVVRVEKPKHYVEANIVEYSEREDMKGSRRRSRHRPVRHYEEDFYSSETEELYPPHHHPRRRRRSRRQPQYYYEEDYLEDEEEWDYPPSHHRRYASHPVRVRARHDYVEPERYEDNISDDEYSNYTEEQASVPQSLKPPRKTSSKSQKSTVTKSAAKISAESTPLQRKERISNASEKIPSQLKSNSVKTSKSKVPKPPTSKPKPTSVAFGKSQTARAVKAKPPVEKIIVPRNRLEALTLPSRAYHSAIGTKEKLRQQQQVRNVPGKHSVPVSARSTDSSTSIGTGQQLHGNSELIFPAAFGISAFSENKGKGKKKTSGGEDIPVDFAELQHLMEEIALTAR
jgi:hypothetical protein